MISSKLSAKDSRAPASRAERIIGRVISRNVTNVPAPRSIDASSRLPPSRRRRAMALLKMVTMQKVACETTRVKNPSRCPPGEERIGQGDAGHHTGQRDRQDDQATDRVPTVEAEPLQRHRPPIVPRINATSVAIVATSRGHHDRGAGTRGLPQCGGPPLGGEPGRWAAKVRSRC